MFINHSYNKKTKIKSDFRILKIVIVDLFYEILISLDCNFIVFMITSLRAIQI